MDEVVEIMSASSDISNLFKQFGGNPDLYQELSEPVSNDSHTSPSVGSGSVESVLAAAPSAASHESKTDFSATAVPSQGDSERVPQSQITEAPLSPWSAAGLQSLLTRLSAQRRAKPSEQAGSGLEHIQVLAVVSAKGGVGRSTLAANLAMALQKAGRQTLALDFDTQNALHRHFKAAEGFAFDEQSGGLAGFDEDCRKILRSTQSQALLMPYGAVDEDGRQAFEDELARDPSWLAHCLERLALPKGTVVIIDTPSGPSIYLRQALAVANMALVVSLADAASSTSLPQIDRLIKTYTADRETFAGSAYVINQVDPSNQLNRDICQILHGRLGKQIAGVVHSDHSISEALAYNRNLLEHQPPGPACAHIHDCAQALIDLLDSSVRVEQTA